MGTKMGPGVLVGEGPEKTEGRKDGRTERRKDGKRETRKERLSRHVAARLMSLRATLGNGSPTVAKPRTQRYVALASARCISANASRWATVGPKYEPPRKPRPVTLKLRICCRMRRARSSGTPTPPSLSIT